MGMNEGEYFKITISEASIASVVEALPRFNIELVNIGASNQKIGPGPSVDPLEDETFGMIDLNMKGRRALSATKTLTLRREKNDQDYAKLKPYGDQYLAALGEYENAKRTKMNRKSHGIVFSSIGFAFSALGLFLLIGASIVNLILSSVEGMDTMPYSIVPIILYSITGLFVAIGIAFLIAGLPRWLGKKTNDKYDETMASSKRLMDEAMTKASAITSQKA